MKNQEKSQAMAKTLVEAARDNDGFVLQLTNSVELESALVHALVGHDNTARSAAITLIGMRVIDELVDVTRGACKIARDELAKPPAPVVPFKHFYAFDEPLPAGRFGAFRLYVDGAIGPVGRFLVPMGPTGGYSRDDVERARHNALAAYRTHLGLPAAA